MRVLAVLIVSLVFASTAFLAEPATAQSSSTLAGRVCTQPTYAPYDAADPTTGCQYSGGVLPGATVTLRRDGTLPLPGVPGVGPTQASATTDANGDYRFDDLDAGDYTLSVARTGFDTVTQEISVSGSARQDIAMKGQQVEAAGDIVDASGAAVANAEVSLCCSQEGDGRDTTGADGAFAILVTAGHMSISVSAPGFQSLYESRLVDGASDIHLVLQRLPAQDAKVSGTVRDQDGNPVAGARVAISNYGGCYRPYAGEARPMEASSDGGSSGSSEGKTADAYSPCYSPAYYGENYTFSGADGKFLLGAYSGYNTLSASKEGHAYASLSVVAEANKTVSQDIELLRFPEKTARIEGRIVDGATGKAVRNAYLNVQSPEFGLYECSQQGEPASGSGSATATSVGAPESSIAPGEPYPAPGCAITLDSDGSFSGLVTPGYAIVSVWVDWYSSCSETRDADGSTRRDCGPEYYSWSSSQVLAGNDTTRIDIRLRSRPAPDAVVSGYVLDADSGQAIPGAQVSFSNQDSYGWGSATTDQDGSYAIRLRSGYHTVSVWAEGHLRWEGVVAIAKGDTPFDVTLQPGQESYGGSCCYAYAQDSAVKSSGAGSTAASPVGAPMATGDSEGSSSQSDQYQDLGGGLGPYDASKRQSELSEPSDGAPGLGLVALLAALGAMLMLRRRTA